ncbi:MAG: response regulator [Nitrosomonadales bacterium]|nr:response regulator [Nitrosomonadales bacterium]
MKIQSRVFLLTVSMTTLTMVAALGVSSYLVRVSLQADAMEKISTVLQARHSALSTLFREMEKDVGTLALSHTTAGALRELSEGYARLDNGTRSSLRAHLSADQSGQNLPAVAMHTSSYLQALNKYAPVFRERRNANEWEDMYLVDTQGNVVFSALKKSDFATNLVSGTWKNTGLAQAVKPLLQDATPGALSFSDFSHYAPKNDQPTAFVATPMFDADKKVLIGVAVIQFPVSKVNALMQDNTGMGETGEAFIVGKDGWMVSDSRFDPEGSILKRQVKTDTAQYVLAGESGLGEAIDYRGHEVLVAYKPIHPFKGAMGDHPAWGVIVKIDTAEVFEAAYGLFFKLFLMGGLLALFAFAVSVRGARGISRPLLGVRDALTRLSHGEQVEVPGLERIDEIGEMAQAAELFRKMADQVEHEHWVIENVASVTGAVSEESAIGKAADRALHLLCEKLDIPVGAIFLLDKDRFNLVGTHGLARRDQAEDGFLPGVGVVGQCAKDNEVAVISPVPVGLSAISTGLAEFQPHELVLYPITHKGAVLAVLELAALKTLGPRQHEFLKAVTAALGLHLANLQSAEHNSVLLAETQKQSMTLKAQQESLLRSNEEMQALTEELRSQAEEMKAQNEELRANQEELRAQQEEVKHKNILLEAQSSQLREVIQETEAKAQELQRANQYKSEFLANMSHELRTPLNSVLILSKNLAENEERNLTPEQIESATVISESGTQLLTLINDILDLSKIEAGKLELQREEFRLDDMLAYLRRIFSPQAEKKQLEFGIQVDAALPEMIYSDRQRLTQVLTNLLANAIKFTDSGEVKVMVSKDYEHLQFEVVDTGIGIPADKLDYVFGAFQQVDGSISRKYGGSGLGLAISRQLAELLGGEIVVKSEPGKGSRFTIRLFNCFSHPELVTDTKVQAKPPTVRTAPSARAVTANAGSEVLVVEDDTRLQAILERMIRSLGFAPVCASSAEQALSALEKSRPEGILLDLGLPHMSGLELLRRLKTDKATADIPIYIMSGAADSGEAKVLGALGFLKKPVTRDSILAAIRAMVGGGHQAGLKRILLVDDNPADIKVITTIFRKDEVEIVPSKSGGGALQLLQKHRFDTVILDLQLPDMTGFEWLKQARHMLNPPPVVVYSARDLTEEEVFELKEVTESIVTKSVLNDRLRDEVLLALKIDMNSSRIRTPVGKVGTGKRLLLVDDDARNLFALTKVLRSRGYFIEVAPDGARALEKLAGARFEAVLTDIMMPDMDGYELIRQIRALGYTDIPIIAITAKAMQGDDVLCMEAGATAYMAKPVDTDRLVELLRGI